MPTEQARESASSTGLRARLRAARDSLRWLEARLRARLPQRWGGPFTHAQCTARELMQRDGAPLAQLRAAAPELFEHALLSGEDFFGVGLFVRERLVAAGFCRALGPAERPYQRALFYADFVTPRLRRRHLGRALHSARLERLRERGAEVVYAWVEQNNAAAQASLRACGFERTAREPIWGEPSGDHVLLRCVLA